eukprot:scaffold4613_cov129-Isochrysis_galbana.AAC.19
MRGSPMCLAPSAPILFPQRLQGPNKEQLQTVSAAAYNKASAFGLGRGSGRAHKRGECRVLLEGLADVRCSLDADAIPIKTARAKQGAATNSVSAPADNKASAFWLGVVGKRALTRGR